MSQPQPLKVRIPARTREKVERMCAQYAANLAAVILQGVEKQLNDELRAAMEPPRPAPAARLEDLGSLEGLEVLRL
jgi:hypothetical protein